VVTPRVAQAIRPQYARLDPARLHAVLLVFVHVVRAALDAGLLRPPRELCWVKQAPTHLAIHLETTLATLAAAGVFPIERRLLYRAFRWAEAKRPDLLAPHAPIVYFDGKRDRRTAEVLDWPAVLRFLGEHADGLKPVALPRRPDASSVIVSTAAESA
jgi:hypothetical protein